MITFIELTRKTKFEQCDYTFENADDMVDILPILTPKFTGNWRIDLIDPRVKSVLLIVENSVIPNYVDCKVYLGQAKLNMIFMKHPNLMAKKQKPWDAFLLMIAEMNHPIDPRATSYLFKALNGDVDKLKEALVKLDTECAKDTVDISMVKQDYTLTRKATYASEVVLSFYTKRSNRWKLYDNLVKDIGQSYAYYSIRKQVMKWLKDKNDYLSNKEVDNKNIQYVDAPFIVYTYFLFSNSTSPCDLPALMYEWDNRCEDVVERRLYANL